MISHSLFNAFFLITTYIYILVSLERKEPRRERFFCFYIFDINNPVVKTFPFSTSSFRLLKFRLLHAFVNLSV